MNPNACPSTRALLRQGVFMFRVNMNLRNSASQRHTRYGRNTRQFAKNRACHLASIVLEWVQSRTCSRCKRTPCRPRRPAGNGVGIFQSAAQCSTSNPQGKRFPCRDCCFSCFFRLTGERNEKPSQSRSPNQLLQLHC